MSADNEEQPAGMVLKAARLDPSARYERWGLTALLLMMLMWAKPYCEQLFQDHRDFLKTTSGAITEQTKLLGSSDKRIERIESDTDKTVEMVRDIHGRVIHAAAEREGPTVVDKQPVALCGADKVAELRERPNTERDNMENMSWQACICTSMLIVAYMYAVKKIFDSVKD